MVQRLAPDLPINLPPGKPNTKRAIALAASQLQHDRKEALHVVRAMYRAFWHEGKDLSNPLVLDEFGIVDGTDLDQLTKDWRENWQATGHAGVPLLVAPDGQMLVGFVPPDGIRQFMKV